MRICSVLVFSTLLLFQASCSKKSDDGGSRGSGVTGTIYGQVIVDQATCGTSVATLSLSGAYSGVQSYTRQVYSGASFDFGAVTSGTYTMSAQAGNCYVQAQNVGPISSGQTPYRVCLTTNSLFCQQNGYYKMAATTTPPTQSKASATSVMTNCNWITFGCNSASYPGSGTAVTVNRHFYFYPNKDITNVNLGQKFKNANTKTIFSTPTLGSDGWTFSVGTDSLVDINNVKYPSLSTDAQFDHSVLQNSSGTCVARGEMIGWISQYLKDQGFQGRSIAHFAERNKNEVPPNDKVCIYPQTFTQTDQVVEYDSTEDIELKRVWFLIIPELHAEVMKLRVSGDSLKAWFTKPTINATASMKENGAIKPYMLNASRPANTTAPTRSVANKYYLPTEEIALVFMLEN